ncbi:hypothetical protein VIGAN_04336100 [Vigna angularis var. angularis]|uniref:Uncharacterized protein n=1 Tax=Vigna angularis var. angularis TaxID=157739 RepID=A0A0S3RZ32_PHAAN|nr:hypothetical protein VIGAN_04336100 [Vigna angularis var. angularis]
MGYGNVTSGGGGAAATLCVWPAMPIHNYNPSVNPAVGFVHDCGRVGRERRRERIEERLTVLEKKLRVTLLLGTLAFF